MNYIYYSISSVRDLLILLCVIDAGFSVERAYKIMQPTSQSSLAVGDIAIPFFANADVQTAAPERPSFYGQSFSKLLRQTLRLPSSVIIASIAINLLGLALPLTVLQVFDRVLKNQSSNTLILLLAGLLLTLVVETFLRLVRNKLMHQVALREGFHLHMSLMGSILHSPRSTTSKLSASTTSIALSAADEMNGFLAGGGRLALLDFPFIFIFLGMIACIGGGIIIIPIILIAGFIARTIWSSEAIKAVLKKQLTLDHERFRYYAECLKGIGTVKSLAIEPQMVRRLEAFLQSSSAVGHELVLKTNRMNASGQLFASLVMISIVSYGGVMAINGSLSLGALAACILIGNRVVQPVMRIIGVWGQLETAKLAQSRYAPLMTLPQLSPAPRNHTPAKIELKNVLLDHDNERALPAALGIQLTVHPAEVVGIIKRDAVQREQLFGLLRGTVSPSRGSVLIDDTNPANIEGDAAQQGIIFIGNSPVIFRGSILDNISMFGCASHVAAISAARALGLEPIIQALPQGYDTRLDDVGGSALSTDILRAICLARAVAVQPRALLLDVRRIPPKDVSTRACTKAIEELRGKTTILIFGKYASEMRGADRAYALQENYLQRISDGKIGNFTEQSRQLIADAFKFDTKT